MKHKLLTISILLVGLLILNSAYRSYQNRNVILADAVYTFGTVIDVQKSSDVNSSSGYTYRTVISYLDSDELPHTYVSETGYSTSQEHLLGAKLDVIYQKSNPNNVLLDTEYEKSHKYIYSTMIGLLFLVIAVSVYVFSINNKSSIHV
ncbi:MAG: hypothetical protein ACJATI_001040 [Halioglobus sp.]|jgi:hypothetical protein